MDRVPRLARPEHAFWHRHTERVRFGDTDAAGVVYYANYLRWFEAGRAELMRAGGLPYSQIVHDRGLFMPVVEAWSRYHRPARYDDSIQITSWAHEVRAATTLIAHQIHRGDELLAEGAARLACLDESGKPRRLPAEIVAMIRQGGAAAG